MQPDGRLFVKPEILRAGWQLELPADARLNRAPVDVPTLLEPSLATTALADVPERGALDPATMTTTPVVHTVVRGDSLWKICEQYLGREPTWADIRAVVAANDGRVDPTIVDPNLIYPGQELDLSVLGPPASSMLQHG